MAEEEVELENKCVLICMITVACMEAHRKCWYKNSYMSYEISN